MVNNMLVRFSTLQKILQCLSGVLANGELCSLAACGVREETDEKTVPFCCFWKLEGYIIKRSLLGKVGKAPLFFRWL